MATNSKYWRLTVLWKWKSYREKSWRSRTTLNVKCDCWKIFDISKYSVTSWHTKSCWCLQKEICSEIWKKTWPINCIKAHLGNKWKIWKLNKNYKWNNKIWINIRNSIEYQNWRTTCFQRDNYICQISWQKWWDLIVHHLEPFNIIISDLDINNFRECELLWELKNWITITKELHNEFHKIYWKKNFTRENFIEFWYKNSLHLKDNYYGN